MKDTKRRDELLGLLDTFAMHGVHVSGHLHVGIANYIANGRPVGDFLTAVICNDLTKACNHGDPQSLRCLHSVVSFFYNHAPEACWGSEEKMEAWIEAHQPKELTLAEKRHYLSDSVFGLCLVDLQFYAIKLLTIIEQGQQLAINDLYDKLPEEDKAD